MKKNIHPQYGLVIFEDSTSGKKFLVGSTMTSKQTATWDDGNTYPVIKVEITSASHPFYTGKQTLVDTAGRVDKFRAKQKKAEELAELNKDKKKKTGKKKSIVEYVDIDKAAEEAMQAEEKQETKKKPKDQPEQITEELKGDLETETEKDTLTSEDESTQE